MQAYSRASRESDPHALPDLEIFEVSETDAAHNSAEYEGVDEPHCIEPGFYWQSCSPGCLPDSDAFGPFNTADEALADARQGLED